MAKLPSIAGKDVVAAFSRLGFYEIRVESSHHVLKKPGHRYALSVPVHQNKPVKKGTLRSLIRDAGVTVEEFLAVLS
jgi:predicted RNA binding protein YcfA (HicA-like mRNA interferase family)